MTEDEVFASVQGFRALVQEKYRMALGACRFEYLDEPTPEQKNWVIRMNISLGRVVGGSGKFQRLQACEVLSTLFGWNPGTPAEVVWEAYERLKEVLGRGHASRAYEEIRKDAARIWGLGSTKDLYLAELSALIEWLEEHNGIMALQAIAAAPTREWVRRLAKLDPVSRPSNYVPPVALTTDEWVEDPQAGYPDEPIPVAEPDECSEDFLKEWERQVSSPSPERATVQSQLPGFGIL